MQQDRELLAMYVQSRSQAAFAQLVARHVDWVWSCALRQVADRHLAEDVTQAVFMLLAQKGKRISPKVRITGWLFRATEYCARSAKRREARRRTHERRAAAMKSPIARTSQEQEARAELAVALDGAVGRLKSGEREAILLRFYRRESLPEVAAALGISQEGARKRLSRALAKLRTMLLRQKIALPVAAVAGVLEQSASGAAPAGFVGAMTAGATGAAGAAGASAASTSAAAIAKGAITMMAWTKAKVAAAVCAGVLLTGTTSTVVVKSALAQGLFGVQWPTSQPAPATQERPEPQPMSLEEGRERLREAQQGPKYSVILNLDMPDLVPEAVQFAIMEQDPIPGFEQSLRRNRGFSMAQLEQYGEAYRRSIELVQMRVKWDFGFKSVSGDSVYLLWNSGPNTHSISGDIPGDGKVRRGWLVTKVRQIGEEPIVWSVPFEVPAGETGRITLSRQNMLDIESIYHRVMEEQDAAK